MKNKLTPDQLKALEIYQETGELGILSNILIDDCFTNLLLPNLEKFNTVSGQRFSLHDTGITFCLLDHSNDWLDLDSEFGYSLIIPVFLSRTPKGEAVMPFLDKNGKCSCCEPDEDVFVHENYCNTNITLDHLLHREFIEALRIGKSFDEALETITKIYLKEIYV